jgi:Xaa-Pro aminopeptidase
MPQSHAGRRQRLAAKLAESRPGADAALITNLTNVRYLTGLASSNAALLVVAEDVSGAVRAGGSQTVLATDTRYALAAERECPDVELVIDRATAAALVTLAAGRGLRRLAFEAHAMTVEEHTALSAEMTGIELTPLGRVVEELRMIKDEEEIANIASACRITSEAFDQVRESILPGMTEKQLAVVLERTMVELGAERPAFDTIVASGPNGAFPHHVPGERSIERGDLITIDMGARVRGYHADMTRTIAVGEPAVWQRELYQLVAAAQRAGVDAALPGAAVAHVDAAARDLIKGAGQGEHFGHGLGHGIGLEIHEAPLMNHDAAGTLGDRVTITVEPGVYIPGRGGVRIEDTLVVRAGTRPGELLTTTTKDLLVI